MASVAAGVKAEKPSFAKIAAAGLKPPSTQQNPNSAENTQKHGITSPPRDGANLVTPSNIAGASAFTPKQKKIVPALPRDVKEAATAPQVHVQNVDRPLPHGQVYQVTDRRSLPSTIEETADQVSSSSGSGKPPSVGGKSVASGTTFTLDEKESLRPDDSASVKATEDEDLFSAPVSELPESRTGSNDELRAFREQLREISAMEQPKQSVHSEVLGRGSNPSQGVLYVPPRGSGVGIIPPGNHAAVSARPTMDFPPDSKLLEALDSPKDRIMVLKLEQDIADFVKDAKEVSLTLPQTNAFYRMLAHKLADYYLLNHVYDEATMAVRIYKTPECRLAPPLTGIATPSTAASTPPPAGAQMKILRRGMGGNRTVIVNGSGTPSKTTSENGDSGNDDEKRPAMPASREEREARYEAARKRIMGSAKPSESPEAPIVVKDESRSSSAAGKKTHKKKQRADSDDDFEARSAYSAYYPTQTAFGMPSHPYYGFNNVSEPNGSYLAPSVFLNHDANGYSQHPVPEGGQWPSSPYQQNHSMSNWYQHQQSGYDISADFQRSMSMQETPMQYSSPHAQQAYNAPYQQHYHGEQQTWTPQQAYAQPYTGQSATNYGQNYANRPPSSGQGHDSQPYAYGQLPSQAFPGRPPSKLEHPLPGSYKGKHFNPQSQAFIPKQANATNVPFFSPQAPPSTQLPYGSGYATPGSLQRHNSGTSQGVAFSPPPNQAMSAASARVPSQPMMHPLPQPVFPRQPSPNMPLPPKPEATPPWPADRNNAPAIVSSTPNQSSIAKWGTPASLPAKPPPSVEPYDTSRFAQPQRQMPGVNRMPMFGAMGSNAVSMEVNGHGTHSPR